MLGYRKIKWKIKLAVTFKDAVKYLSSCIERGVNYLSPNDQRRREIFTFLCVCRPNCSRSNETPRGDDFTTIQLYACVNCHANSSQLQKQGTYMTCVTIPASWTVLLLIVLKKDKTLVLKFPYMAAPSVMFSVHVFAFEFDVYRAVHRNIIFIVKPTRCTNVTNLFYFRMTFYMFRTVFPSIIRSSRLYIQQQAFVKQILMSAC